MISTIGRSVIDLLEQAGYASRLFLRLKEAWSEFAEAAGIPPDMALLSETVRAALAEDFG